MRQKQQIILTRIAEAPYGPLLGHMGHIILRTNKTRWNGKPAGYWIIASFSGVRNGFSLSISVTVEELIPHTSDYFKSIDFYTALDGFTICPKQSC